MRKLNKEQVVLRITAWFVLAWALLVCRPLLAAVTCSVAAEDFTTATFSNQAGNGGIAWTTNWLEVGDDGSPNSGDFVINSGSLKLYSDCCVWDNPNDSIEREVDLSTLATAELRVSTYRSLFGVSKVALDISADGGTSWTTLKTYQAGGLAGYYTDIFDITPYISANTRIRFRNNQGGSDLDWMGVTSIEIRSCSGTADPNPSCGNSFPSGAAIHDGAGRVDFFDNSQIINNPSAVIAAPIVNHWLYTADTLYGTYTCDTWGHCTASSTTAPGIDPGPFPSFSETIDWDPDCAICSHSGEGLPGEARNSYDYVQVDVGQSVVFTNKRFNTFYIKRLAVEASGVLYLPPGDYYIESIDHIYAGAQLIVTEPGTVRLYVKNKFITSAAGVILNSGGYWRAGVDPSQLVIYGYDDIELHSETVISGYLYARGAVNMPASAVVQPMVTGAITAANIWFGTLTRMVYDPLSVENVDFGGMCPEPTPDHFAVSHSGSAVTCETEAVTISVHDIPDIHTGDHAAMNGYQGTVTVSTSTGQGDWILLTGAGTFNNGAAGDGVATYEFAGTETNAQVVLGLKHRSGATVNINVTDGTVTEPAGDATEDPDLVFSDTGFQFLVDNAVGNINTQIAGKSSDEGFNAQTIGLRAIATDPDTGECTARLPAGNHTVEFAYECVNPASCAATNPNALGVSGTPVASNNNGAVASYTPVTLTFDGNATTELTLNYGDAGKLQLHARKLLADEDAGPDITLSDASNEFIVRPFGIGFSNIRDNSGNPNPGGTTAGGGLFVPAGAAFDFDVAAYQYQAGEDADADGIPDLGVDVTDNGLLPNFGGTANVTVSAITPGGGVTGTLGTTSVVIGGGAVTVDDQTYSEVGSIRLQAALDYLGDATAALQGESPDIGLFYPAGFTVTNNRVAAAGSCNDGDPATTDLAYMGQDFNLAFTLSAVNTGGAVVQNYSTALGYPVNTVAFYAEESDDGVDRAAGRLSLTGSETWAAGVYSDGSNADFDAAVQFVRDAAPDGPYNSLQLGLAVLGTPAGAGLAGLDMNAATSGDCTVAGNCDAVALGSIDMRYGRIAALPAYGPEGRGDLPVPLEVQHWNGVNFTRNTNDSCTQYGTAGSAVTGGALGAFTTYDPDNLDAGETVFQAPAAMQSFATGVSSPVVGNSFSLRDPGVGNWGTIDVSFTVDSPFTYDWDNNGATAETGPTTRATFGTYRADDRIIFWREVN